MIRDLIYAHPIIVALSVYYLFSSVVTALPLPTDESSTLYKFFFNFLHILSANILRIPQVRNLIQK